MSETAAAPPPTGQRPASEPAAGGLITQHVRHAYWKYPIIALVLAVALGLLGVFAGSLAGRCPVGGGAAAVSLIAASRCPAGAPGSGAP